MKSAIDAYEKLVLDRPVLTLSLLFALLMLFAAFIPRFELDVSADSLILENDADLEYYRNIRARYGSDDYLILTYTPKDQMFSETSLQRLAQLRDRLSEIERVESVLTILDVHWPDGLNHRSLCTFSQLHRDISGYEVNG